MSNYLSNVAAIHSTVTLIHSLLHSGHRFRDHRFRPTKQAQFCSKKAGHRHSRNQGGSHEAVEPPSFREWRRGAFNLAADLAAYRTSAGRERVEVPSFHRHA